MTASKSMGFGKVTHHQFLAVTSTSVLTAGAVATKMRMVCRSRSLRRVRERGRRQLHRSSTGCRCWNLIEGGSTLGMKSSCWPRPSSKAVRPIITPASAGMKRGFRPSLTKGTGARPLPSVDCQAQGPGQYPAGHHQRINTPEAAEQVLAEGDADMVSMARSVFWPMPTFVNKGRRRQGPMKSIPGIG